MNAQNSLSSFQVGQFNGNAAVKTSGTRQRGVERFGSVRRRKNDNARVALKTVHFRQQLVQGLFTLVVAAYARIALAAYRVYLIDKYYARSLFFCLVEQVADF